MGCGASSKSRLMTMDGGKVTDASQLMTLLAAKPVVGGTTANVVQGSPVMTSVHLGHAENAEAATPESKGSAEDAEAITDDAAESQRKSKIVQGLVESATALISTNPVAAAGFAMAAADVAEAMPPSLGHEATPSHVASGFAFSALVAANAGSKVAEGLIEAAVSAAADVAQTRSKASAAAEAAHARRKAPTIDEVVIDGGSSTRITTIARENQRTDLVEVCRCGKTFRQDSRFCGKCGSKREARCKNLGNASPLAQARNMSNTESRRMSNQSSGSNSTKSSRRDSSAPDLARKKVTKQNCRNASMKELLAELVKGDF